MKSLRLLLTIPVLFLVQLPLLSQEISFSDSSWVINSRAHVIENFKGHNSLYLQGGFAYLPEADFENGIIEYDMYMTERVSFAGLVWRITEGMRTYEEFYTRSHHSTHPDAYQYTPVYNGMAAWQLYHDGFTGNNNGLMGFRPLGEGQGFNGILDLKMDQWVHYKFLIKDQRAELYIDYEEEPSVVMNTLMIPKTKGGLGFFCGAGPTHFANLKYTKTDDVELKTEFRPLPKLEEGMVMKWEISGPFEEKEISGTELSDEFIKAQKWNSVESDAMGLLNLSRFTPFDRKNNTVLVRIDIRSDSDKVVPVKIGFSDRVKAYHKGKAIFSGEDNFRSRDYRYLGTIGFFDTVYFDLEKGKNTVYFAVSENFGGWGIQAVVIE